MSAKFLTCSKQVIDQVLKDKDSTKYTKNTTKSARALKRFCKAKAVHINFARL